MDGRELGRQQQSRRRIKTFRSHCVFAFCSFLHLCAQRYYYLIASFQPHTFCCTVHCVHCVQLFHCFSATHILQNSENVQNNGFNRINSDNWFVGFDSSEFRQFRFISLGLRTCNLISKRLDVHACERMRCGAAHFKRKRIMGPRMNDEINSFFAYRLPLRIRIHRDRCECVWESNLIHIDRNKCEQMFSNNNKKIIRIWRATSQDLCMTLNSEVGTNVMQSPN